jgi:hypothetical protein
LKPRLLRRGSYCILASLDCCVCHLSVNPPTRFGSSCPVRLCRLPLQMSDRILYFHRTCSHASICTTMPAYLPIFSAYLPYVCFHSRSVGAQAEEAWAVLISATDRSRIWETHIDRAAPPNMHETLRPRLQSRPISSRSRRGTSTSCL